jgi:hypothetical protein
MAAISAAVRGVCCGFAAAGPTKEWLIAGPCFASMSDRRSRQSYPVSRRVGEAWILVD